MYSMLYFDVYVKPCGYAGQRILMFTIKTCLQSAVKDWCLYVYEIKLHIYYKFTVR